MNHPPDVSDQQGRVGQLPTAANDAERIMGHTTLAGGAVGATARGPARGGVRGLLPASRPAQARCSHGTRQSLATPGLGPLPGRLRPKDATLARVPGALLALPHHYCPLQAELRAGRGGAGQPNLCI